jgi:hypothetical protein
MPYPLTYSDLTNVPARQTAEGSGSTGGSMSRYTWVPRASSTLSSLCLGEQVAFQIKGRRRMQTELTIVCQQTHTTLNGQQTRRSIRLAIACARHKVVHSWGKGGDDARFLTMQEQDLSKKLHVVTKDGGTPLTPAMGT